MNQRAIRHDRPRRARQMRAVGDQSAVELPKPEEPSPGGKMLASISSASAGRGDPGEAVQVHMRAWLSDDQSDQEEAVVDKPGHGRFGPLAPPPAKLGLRAVGDRSGS